MLLFRFLTIISLLISPIQFGPIEIEYNYINESLSFTWDQKHMEANTIIITKEFGHATHPFIKESVTPGIHTYVDGHVEKTAAYHFYECLILEDIELWCIEIEEPFYYVKPNKILLPFLTKS